MLWSKVDLEVLVNDSGLERDAVREILLQVDGRRSVGEIVDGSIYPKFMVLRTLYHLVLRGAVRIQNRGEGLCAGSMTSAHPVLQ